MTASFRFLILCIVPGSALASADVEFHKDVMPLIEARCVNCHAHDGVSFSFENPDDAYNLRMAIASAVAERRMPPWLAEAGHQSYVGDYSLTAEERAMIAAWAAAEYPRGEALASKAIAPKEKSFDSDLSISVLPNGSYLPDQNRKDDYRCFVMDWPYETDMYVTGFKAEPGNLRVSHHLVNYAVGPEAAKILKTLSAEEDGPGHQCFGGPLPDSIDTEEEREKLESRFPGGWEKMADNNFWLTQWAPGMYGQEFPDGTGILMRPGSIVVVQMHYYSAFAPGESDSNTIMHFRLAENVDKPLVNLPITNNRWLKADRNDSMTIMPGDSATYETSRNFEQIANYIGRALDIDSESVAAIELQSANVHMHAFGAHGTTSLLDTDGHKETLLRIPRWDIDWQRDFMFTEPKTVPRSEFADTRLIVECTFSNHTDETVYGGFGSDDEMCFNFSYAAAILGDQRQVAGQKTAP